MRLEKDIKTVSAYIDSLPYPRQLTMNSLRQIVLSSLPAGYEEILLGNMIGYVVPLSVFPEGYLGNKNIPLMYMALAAQKNYYSLYMMSLYGDKRLLEWFTEEFAKSHKKLNMGKSCLRFKNLTDLPLDLIVQTIAKVPMEKYIQAYQNSRKLLARSKSHQA